MKKKTSEIIITCYYELSFEFKPWRQNSSDTKGQTECRHW